MTRGDDLAAWSRLAAAVGDDRVAIAGEAARIDGVAARLVVRPRSIDEVRAAVRACAEGDLTIVASGRGRHMDVGARPERCDVLLRLEGLDAVLDHQPGDMTVSAAAGCTLSALEAALARHGQWLPLDPPLPEATTLGGLIAANLSGPLRSSQGTARDLLLGLELVDATGALVRGGGRVVKNVAGYDLPKLHVGALGSLGVIVAATFKVRPRPPVERALAIDCATADEAVLLGLAIRDAAAPSWLELAQTDAGAGGEPPASAGRAWTVVAGAAGIEAEVAEALARIDRLAGVRGARARAITDGAACRARLGGRFARNHAAVLKAAVLPTDVGRAVAALLDAARAADAELEVGAHLSSGIVRAGLARGTPVAAVGPLIAGARERAAGLGGSLVLERAAASVKAAWGTASEVWGDAGPGLGLMRGVKAALDPQRILAPGRLPGGI